jgi:hypothetical protein
MGTGPTQYTILGCLTGRIHQLGCHIGLGVIAHTQAHDPHRPVVFFLATDNSYLMLGASNRTMTPEGSFYGGASHEGSLISCVFSFIFISFFIFSHVFYLYYFYFLLSLFESCDFLLGVKFIMFRTENNYFVPTTNLMFDG